MQDVRGAPTHSEQYPALRDVLAGNVVACHTPFDRVALSRIAAKDPSEHFHLT
jgi:hypothetical protein